MKIGSGNDEEGLAVAQQAHDWRLRRSDPAVRWDEAAFERWLTADPRHRRAFERAVAVDHVLAGLDRGMFDARLHETAADVRPQQHTPNPKPLRSPGLWAAAAAILICALALILRPYASEPQADAAPRVTERVLETGIGEIAQAVLEDGTQVTLGASTTLELTFSARTRTLQLRHGDALFDVAADADRPFTVAANNLRATALGTRFEVRHNGGVARVAVAEGIVEVTHPVMIGGRTSGITSQARLQAGQQVQADRRDGLAEAQSDSQHKIATWREARLDYLQAPLEEVLATANRYTPAELLLHDPEQRLVNATVSGSFKSNNIDNLIDSLPQILPVTVDRSMAGRVLVQAQPLR